MCPPGFYGDAASLTCVPCSARCLTCTGGGSTECTTCLAAFYLSGNSCVQSCPDGFYGDATTRQCAGCAVGCRTCTGAANGSCTSCDAPYFLAGSTCAQGCPDGFYENAVARRCMPCDSMCQSCAGAATMCTACLPLSNRVPSAGACVCPPGYVPNYFLHSQGRPLHSLDRVNRRFGRWCGQPIM